MDMSIPYELGGRTHQKARTRDGLIQAARDLLAQGITPTVEQAAAAAAISRTTAYRYFRNQRALLIAAHPEIEKSSLLPEDAPADPEGRLDACIAAFTRQNVDTEPQLRAMLRLSLDPEPPRGERLVLRRGRAIGWIEDALSPLCGTLSEAEVRRLAVAIRSATGIEALVWLTDVAGLPREKAVATMRWSARAMLRLAVTEGPPPSL
jgi:AcrR family transcriptional regulator